MDLRADSPLSERVRIGTRAEHEAAQGSGFLDALASGRLPIQAYADLAAQHWFIYETLEQAARAMADDPVAGDFVFRSLYRLPALNADLRFLLGANWADRITALPATTIYCTRMRTVTLDRPSAFIAHHYTRYLGDLSGGQYLGPSIARAYGLSVDGHRFFVFEGIDAPAFRSRYRGLLDRLEWPRPVQDAFVDEVAQAYRLNIAVLNDLKERWT
jgi:heme oxygenase (biliverdin-producing, ferredoxin)